MDFVPGTCRTSLRFIALRERGNSDLRKASSFYLSQRSAVDNFFALGSKWHWARLPLGLGLLPFSPRMDCGGTVAAADRH
jgi:hypothetical protein